jgi:predicted dithiol-disulfide oxidoreductase (DUF899 family)
LPGGRVLKRNEPLQKRGPVWSFLDLTPYGRQEEWEDSPEDYPQTPPYQWWNYHDKYGTAA